MPDFLVFTLVAPMGAFGDLAGHERRGGYSMWPGKSAILGLIGASLGVRRDEVERQQELKRSSVAVSILAQGSVLRDYHTVQTVPRSIKSPNSRREALRAATEKGNLNTIITERDYVCNCVFGVAVWGMGGLEEVRQALQTPVFMPYLGRKSCPLAAPMSPVIVDAVDPPAALGAVVLPAWLTRTRAKSQSLQPVADPRRPVAIASDPFPGMPVSRVETRWDEPVDRVVWHFGQREVHIVALEQSQ